MFSDAISELLTEQTSHLLAEGRDQFDYNKGKIDGLKTMLSLPDILIARYTNA